MGSQIQLQVDAIVSTIVEEGNAIFLHHNSVVFCHPGCFLAGVGRPGWRQGRPAGEILPRYRSVQLLPGARQPAFVRQNVDPPTAQCRQQRLPACRTAPGRLSKPSGRRRTRHGRVCSPALRCSATAGRQTLTRKTIGCASTRVRHDDQRLSNRGPVLPCIFLGGNPSTIGVRKRAHQGKSFHHPML
jgi:hypothetical protein